MQEIIDVIQCAGWLITELWGTDGVYAWYYDTFLPTTNLFDCLFENCN
jgi:hypothetical protein